MNTSTCTPSTFGLPPVCRPVLLGTDQGLVHELSLDERVVSRKDPGGPRQLLDLRDRRKAICGIYQVGERHVLLLGFLLHMF
jgi:hypothetical protein